LFRSGQALVGATLATLTLAGAGRYHEISIQF
jgi:hypothetical protein